MASFLTTRVTPDQSGENNNAFLAGMHIGATTQGEYEKRQADARATELSDNFTAQQNALKEANENLRKTIGAQETYTKLGMDMQAKSLDSEATQFQNVLNDTSGATTSAQKNAAAIGLKQNQQNRQTLLAHAAVINPVSPGAVPQFPPSYDPTQFAQTDPNFAAATTASLAGKIATSNSEQIKYNTEHANGNTPLPLLMQREAENYKTGQVNNKIDKKPVAQQNEEAKIMLAAPSAISHYHQLADVRSRLEQDKSANPFPSGLDKKYDPYDPRLTQYNAVNSDFRKAYDEDQKVYGENISIAERDNPLVSQLFSEVGAQDGTKNWRDITMAKPLAKEISKRMFDAQQTGDKDKFNSLSRVYNQLGLNAVGSPASLTQQ